MELKICQGCWGTTAYDVEMRKCVSGEGQGVVQVPTFEKIAAVVF